MFFEGIWEPKQCACSGACTSCERANYRVEYRDGRLSLTINGVLQSSIVTPVDTVEQAPATSATPFDAVALCHEIRERCPGGGVVVIVDPVEAVWPPCEESSDAE